ncbi:MULTISPECIES: non-ribosomal peptide synthetase [unclassified Streptomyces]|uniref:non-ribosomal peptide synthetase n=1 Tax=unclassified Streptomyces TaxID=2593676 RepID=UPI0006AD9FD4|nr:MULTISPECIES: non-ribosomal peptide synthetase [unclassified Streptomyces]
MTDGTTGDDRLPLTFGQELIRSGHRAGREAAYGHHPVVALRLTGTLDRAALTSALRGLVARHEPLRTTFTGSGTGTGTDGTSGARVWPAGPVELEYADLTAPGAASDRPEALVTELAARPYDLASGPLLRSLLIRLGAEEHLLVLTVHRIAADTRSRTIVTAELAELYAAAVTGRTARLPELPVRYAQYAAEQRARVTDAELDAQLDHWRGRLAGLPALRLPTDRPRTRARGAAAARHAFRVPAPAVHALAEAARAHGGTLFAGLFAACQVLFSRHTGQEDLALGTLAFGRPRPVLHGLVGAFDNPLLVRGRIRAGAPFTEVLAGACAALAEAHAHQDVPFERVRAALGEGKDAGDTPDVQVMVALRGAEAARPARIPALAVRTVQPPGVPAAHDLTVEFTETGSGDLAGVLEYDAALFDPVTVEVLARHLSVLLGAAAADPARSVEELPLADEEELRLLTTEWAVNRADFPAERCVHELVADQARLRPDAIAVTAGPETLTYAELDARAGRLANLLVADGVRPGTFVAVCLPRGPELVTALLAVLKAGCAYLPLNPDYPQDRLGFMLSDAGVPLCLTESRLTGKLPSTGTRMICLDEQDAALAAQPARTPAVAVTADDPAYLMYTSGSTGTPKGAVIGHRSVVRLFCNADWVRLGPDDVMAQGSDVTFDAATLEIWGPLLAGSRMAVIDKDTLLDPAELTAALRRHGVTTLFVTTAVFNQIVAADPYAFGALRHVLFGGEAANSVRVAEVLAAAPPQRLVNLYGPTETAVLGTWHLIREADEHMPVPIGRAVANTTAYVLDDRLRPVPIGVAGELFIAGPGVARGYLNRPELTADRFLDNPHGEAPDHRMYRTGDLVRWTSAGVIEYVGRADHQVKVRGYRIEPGEIELVLQQHPDVGVALVVALADGEHKRLVGYVTPGAAGRRPQPAELREFVSARLPVHMVPSAVVCLEQFPLTPSGKVDRRALPAPEHAAAPAGATEPRTGAERLLAQIWSDVLGVPAVGVTDNFYELGGDSILGIRVVARAKKAGLVISAKDVFRKQTIAELATTAVAAEAA